MKKSILLAIFVFLAGISNFSYALVGSQFYPNGDLGNVILQTLEDFSKMDSDAGLQVYGGYQTISANTTTILNALPKNEPKYNTLKNNCNTLLGRADASRSGYGTFKTKCMEPLKSAISDLRTKYMVQASGKATPNTGPAPLNVTFDATASIDPSNETIPANNYFWYYRDINGVDKEIGIGPVLNYTFRDEGNYKVHLTVRSSEKNNGYVDGSYSLDVNVLPKVADIIAYGNEKLLTTQGYNKFNISEGQNGIRFNGAGTKPTDGRKIKSHRWLVLDSTGKTIYNYGFEGAPQSVDIKLGSIGTYKIQLYITDNFNQTVFEEYNIVLSDPVTIIKSTPEKVTTAQTKTFDGSLSYTVKNKLESYKWEIYNADKKIDTVSTKSFQKQFTTPGIYKVVLTTKNTAGDVGTDEQTFEVLSTPPVASFSIDPVRKRVKPSQFVLDASASSDYDIQNKVDELSYKWEIVNAPKAGEFISTTDGGRKTTVQFNEKGNFTIRLTVTDKYGASSIKDGNVRVDSTLRPEFVDMPKVMKIGETRTIKVKSNQSNVAYIWNAAGIAGTISESDTQEIKYDRVGVYDVSVTANNNNDESNTVTSRIFVAEKGAPTLAYDVVFPDGRFVEKSQSCSSGGAETYEIDRNQTFSIDTKNSINSRGGNDGLTFIYMIDGEANKNSTAGLSNYKFNGELGCQKIRVFQKEAGSGKTNEVTLYFNVKNSLPKIGNVSISFPQYGDATGIGFNATNTRPLCGPGGYDPILIRVSAINARDDDGTIVRYKWYYFDVDSPDEYKEVKVTPGNLPYAVFSLPQDGNEYSFAVKVEDDDGGITDSKDVVGNAGSFFCESTTTSADKPTVSLSISNAFPKVGEKVTFVAKSSVESSRKDYPTTRIYKYDLDGDGVYDHITKSDKVDWIYSKSGKFEPSVMVTYRGLSSIANLKGNSGKTVTVEKGLYADFLVATIGNNVLIKDSSYGDIEYKNFCMDVQSCDDPKMNVKNKNYFIFPYSTGGTYNIRLDITNKYGEKQTKIQKVTITNSAGGTTGSTSLTTLPAYKKSNGINTIDLGYAMNNEVIFYPSGKDCYVDTDLSSDSDKDGNPKNDQDIKCNVPGKVKYSPSRDEVSFGFFDGKLLQEMKINFLDFDKNISEGNRENYTTTRNLISEIQQSGSKSEKVDGLLSILNNLKDNIEDKSQTSSNIAALKEYLKDNPDLDLPKEIMDRLELLASGSNDPSVAVIDETSEVGKIKAAIVADMPKDMQSDISKSFEDYMNADGDKEKMKNALVSIVSKVQKAHSDKKITDEQATRIKTKICGLVQQAGIATTGSYCSQDIASNVLTGENDLTNTNPKDPVVKKDTKKDDKGGLGSSILKIIGWVAGLLALLFVGLVVFFAQKARREQSKGQNKKTGTGTKTSAPSASPTDGLKFPDAKTATTTSSTTSLSGTPSTNSSTLTPSSGTPSSTTGTTGGTTSSGNSGTISSTTTNEKK